MTTERQIDEIDEQMRIWSRVLDLEKKKEAVVEKVKESKSETMNVDDDGRETDDNDDSDHEDINIDEFLDWRAKNSHK